MKKVSSAVWKFFDRLAENKRCVAVVCKLCESQYKYFGNTTNLRVHLMNKHPLQWELSENGTLDDSNVSSYIEEAVAAGSPKATPTKRRKYKPRGSKNARYSVTLNNESTKGATPKIEIQEVDLNQNSDSDDDDEATTLNLVRQMHGEQQSDEEWLDDDPFQITHYETYEPKSKNTKKNYAKIKREVTSPTAFYVSPKANHTNKVVFEESSRRDECSVFGEYVANKLRKIKTPRTRGNLQQLITTILWQAEYGLYDSTDTVKRVLMMDMDGEPQQIVDFNPLVQNEEVIDEHRDADNQSGDCKTVIN